MIRRFLLLLVVVVAVLMLGSAGDAKQNNILFLLVDDLGWADVGYNGSTFYETHPVVCDDLWTMLQTWQETIHPELKFGAKK